MMLHSFSYLTIKKRPSEVGTESKFSQKEWFVIGESRAASDINTVKQWAKNLNEK